MSEIIQEVTQLFPVEVDTVFVPKNIEDIQNFLKKYEGKISVGGGRYSMGGQTAIAGGAQIDMRSMNRILDFSQENKTITVEAGITWRNIQDYIDPYELSIMTMQTYSNFTVGGSLSVNCHGRYIGFGPIILSVISIRVLLANGELIDASPKNNSEIFFATIGGYGGISIIMEATLKLRENTMLERMYEDMSVEEYGNFFRERIRDNEDIIMHNADIYPPHFSRVRATSWKRSNSEATTTDRLIPRTMNYSLHKIVYRMMTFFPYGKSIRENIIDPLVYKKTEIHKRNYEASYDVAELEPSSRKDNTYVLEEYFCPVGAINTFIPQMREIFQRHDANIVNISIRHALPDSGSYLAWAQEEVFAFVVYYNQKTDTPSRREVAVWTRELIDAVTSVGGRYYLPYQLHGTLEQVKKAYPRFTEYCSLKKQYDPLGKLSNSLLEKYYFGQEDPDSLLPSRFKTIYQSTYYRDKFYLFLQNIFHIAPTNLFHSMIWDIVEKYDTDREIYDQIQKQIPSIKPFLADIKYGIPALKKQKSEMSKQTSILLGNITEINGYLEIGGAGRYIQPVLSKIHNTGPIYLVSDEPIDSSPVRIIERGQFQKYNTRTLTYNSSDFDHITDNSIDLVTIFIGLHHCPDTILNDYITTIVSKVRTGGNIIIRDHDISNPFMHTFVSLAHDIYNAGTGELWQKNSDELRNFRSIPEWKKYIESFGCISSEKQLLQENDPTDNTLMLFTKK